MNARAPWRLMSLAAMVAATAWAGCTSSIKGREPAGSVERLSAQSGFGRAFVSWSGVAGASRYRLLVSTDAAFAMTSDPALADRELSSSSTFQDVTGLTPGRTVWFAVIAVEGSNGEAAPTRAVGAHIPAPDASMGNPLWRIVGRDPTGELGTTVAAAGDVNGDGYDDVIAGEPNDPAAGGTTGEYRVYPGGPAVLRTNYEGFLFADNLRPSITQFGATAGRVGDLDDDGFDDLLIGAAFDTAVTLHEGSFWFIRGDEIVGTAVSVQVSGTAVEDRLGSSFAALTTANGRPAFAVGRPAPGGAVRPGDVLVYAAAPPAAPLTATSTTSGSAFGASLAALGADADPESELAVGEPAFSGGVPQRGRVVLRNGTDFATETVIDQGTTAGERFGTRLASAGDTNGDGAEDLLVTSAGSAPTAFLLLGPAPFTRTVLHVSSSGELAIAGAGDVDDDGFADALVGEPDWNGGTGRVLLFRGGTNEPGSAAAWIGTGDAAGDRFGAAVADAGDVDADGFADLAIGAPGPDLAPGRFELFRGHRGVGLDVNAGLPQRVQRGATALLLDAVVADPLGRRLYAATVDWGDGEPPSTATQGVDCGDETVLTCPSHVYGRTGRFTVHVRVDAPDGRFGEALTTLEVVK